MGLCFRKSITIAPGVRINLSKSGPSLSFGKKGIRETISANGRSTTSIGIPGTGVYYTKTSNVKNLFGGKDKKAAAAKGAKTAAKTSAASKGLSEAELEQNRNIVAEYEAAVEQLKSIHKLSDGAIDWTTLTAGDLAPFAQSVLAGDIDSYFKVIEEVGPFDDLLEYGSSFEVGTDDPSILEVEFNVKSEEVLPTTVLSLKADGTVSEKEMTKTAYYDLMRDYVSSTILRVARDTFALLPVQTVLIHAQDVQVNSATGQDEEFTLVSAKITRNQIGGINFERVDPSDCLNSFECKEKFRKTEGYAPVDRILP